MKIQSVLDQIENLPPMPQVAVQLLEATQDPDVDLGVVAGWIERDAAMTANLLHVCNAPYYGLRREVSSVRQATSLLGLKKVVQIALSVLAAGYLSPSQEGYRLDAGELWKSSITAAMAAEMLAVAVSYESVSTAYTAGLLQDVGKIVLAQFVASELEEIRKLVEEQGVDWEEAEHRIVGIPHAEVGAILLERWGFPPALVESVRTHHHPSTATLDPTLACISHVADALTMSVGVGLGADGLAYNLDETCLQTLALDDQQKLDELVESLAKRVAQAQEILRPPQMRA